jgi:hypothetical protein
MNLPEAAIVPARDGFEWVRLAFKLFRMQWLRYCAITAVFILISQIAGALSGGLLAFFLKPILSVGFLAATWHHERGETPDVKHLFAGFRSNIGALLPLGLFYLFGLLLAVTLGVFASGMDLRILMDAQSTGDTAKIDRDSLMSFMLFTALAMLPINAALWFAPALIVFSDLGPFQALKMSLIACIRNVAAAIVYLLALMVLFFAAFLVVSPLVLLSGSALQGVIVMVAVVPVLAVYMISDYVAYRRVFHRSERLQSVQ